MENGVANIDRINKIFGPSLTTNEIHYSTDNYYYFTLPGGDERVTESVLKDKNIKFLYLDSKMSIQEKMCTC